MLIQTTKRLFKNPRFWKLVVLSVTLIALCQYFGALTVTNQISNKNNLPTPSATNNPNSFISRWDTTKTGSSGNQISLPLVSGGQYNFNVSWGDNSSDIITSYNDPAVNHTYTSSGVYDVNITGTLNGWDFNNSGDCQKIVGISQWGNITLGNSGYYFDGCTNLVLNATDALNLNGTTDLGSAFYNCPLLGTIGNMDGWNVSDVINMSYMFYWDFQFNQPIDKWNVSSVTNMSYMFVSTSFNQNISDWDVSKVTDMSYMFYNANEFNQNISDWDVSSVTDMNSMFLNENAFNQPIGNWDVSSVTDMNSMFDGSSFNQNISDWDVSSVTNMGSMFSFAPPFNQPIGNWNVSKVTDMNSMFFGDSAFNQPIGNWNVSNVQDMSWMFHSDYAFNQSIENWNVSNVQDMSWMFYNDYAFNQSIGNWNVSKVTNMQNMFYNCSSFNQPIGNWNVSSLQEMYEMFYNCSVFNQPIGKWNVSNVYDMEYMFYNDYAFNQSIGNWNVSNVQGTNYMFYNDYSFNQPIGNWTLTSNIGMRYMFYNDSAFNQPIGNWTTSNIGDMSCMFYNDSAFNQNISNWDISSVTNMTDMFTGDTAFSPQNYGALLISWSQLSNLQWYVPFSVGSTQYPGGAATARQYLISNDYWSITDGGLAPTVSTPTLNQISSPSTTGNVTLEWSSSIFDSVYSIYRSNSNITTLNSATWIANVTNNSYQDTNLANGTYYYVILASNGIVNSSISNCESVTVSLSTSTTAPSEPTNLVATAETIFISLTWTAPANNGGSPILYYYIYRANSSTDPYTLIGQSSANSISFDDSNILGGNYYYKITAVNAVGPSNYSNIANATLILAASGPTNLVATSETSYILLTWTASTNDGGSTNLYYDIYRGDSTSGPFTLIGNSTTTSYEDSNVVVGQNYYYKITAVNEAGNSTFSNIVNITLILQPSGATPLEPTNLNAAAETSSILLTWENPANYEVTSNIYYDIYRSYSYNGPFNIIGNSTTNSYNDFDVGHGQTYYYEVTAVNSTGTSSYSNIVSAIISSSSTSTTISKPSEPSGILVMANSTYIIISWNLPVSSGGSPILYYNIYRSDSANGTYTIIGKSTTSFYYDKNVVAGQTYYYKVTAVNILGESGYSNVGWATANNVYKSNTINGMGIGNILTVSFLGVLVAAITMRKRKKS